MKKYVVTVIDFDGKDVDIVVEGIYLNMNEAINTMGKVATELIDNAIFNGKKEIQILHKYDKKFLIKEILILDKDKKVIYQISLNETFE